MATTPQRLILVDAIARSVRARIDHVREDATETNRYGRELATRFDALPLYVDLGGAILLTPDGWLVEFDDDRDALRPVLDPYWASAALVSGARKYGELRSLLPGRPGETTDCSTCGGAGHLPGFGDVLCGHCGGLGWRRVSAR